MLVICQLYLSITMTMQRWFLIESDTEYQKASDRFEKMKEAKKGTIDHKEKMLLVLLMNEYDQKKWSMPEVNPLEFIKIRMEEFGYKPKDLSEE